MYEAREGSIFKQVQLEERIAFKTFWGSCFAVSKETKLF
jgi:hypothetical protein